MILNRSMPANGLEAQDVAPRRQRPDSAADQYLPAFSHARARSPSHPSLILLRLLRWASCCCLDGVGSLPDGTRSAAGAFNFRHLGPNSAYASFGYRQSGSPVQVGRPAPFVRLAYNAPPISVLSTPLS